MKNDHIFEKSGNLYLEVKGIQAAAFKCKYCGLLLWKNYDGKYLDNGLNDQECISEKEKLIKDIEELKDILAQKKKILKEMK